MKRAAVSRSVAALLLLALATPSVPASAATVACTSGIIPGDPLPPSPIDGTLLASQPDHVYRVHLRVGDTIEADSLSASHGVRFYLHGPWAADIGGGVIVAVDYDNPTVHRIRYMATQEGDYYLRVHYNQLNPAIPSVNYRLTWSLRPAGTPPRVKAYLTPPSRPSVVRKGRTFTSYGYLKPRHTAGACSVVIRCYRKVSYGWRLERTVRARNYNYSTYTKYQASVTLPTTGYWKLAAYAPEDYRHLLTTAFSPIFRVY